MFRKIIDFFLWLFGIKKWNPQEAGGSNITPATAKYVNYPNDFVAPLPGAADDTTMYCFPIEANYEKLQALCDQRYNFGLKNSKLRYFPLTKHVMLVASKIEKGYSLVPTYQKPYYVTELAVQIFMPIAECRLNKRNEWVAERIVVGVPYIVVDSPFTMGIGREQIGFPKNIGQFEFPNSPEEATNFNVKAYGVTEFDEANPMQANYYQWMSISKISEEEFQNKKSWKTHGDAWKNIKDTFERIPKNESVRFGLPFLLHELEDLVDGTIPMLFLKQFRDIKTTGNACYQAITEGPGKLKDFLGGWFLGGSYEIQIENFASSPIKEDLGLADQIVVEAPFWIKANLEFAEGTVIWEANAAETPQNTSKDAPVKTPDLETTGV